MESKFLFLPPGNGQNERYNGELQRLITRILKQNGLDSLDWEHCLGEALFILRSRVCESTGSSPHELFFRFCRYFADSDLKLLAKDADFTMNKGKIQRGSQVFIRNFVRVKKTDPLVKGKGLVTDLLSPQLAEIRTPKVTEYVNTRHLAAAPSDKECHPEVAEGSPTVTATPAKYPTATSKTKKPPVLPAQVSGSDALVPQLSPTVRPEPRLSTAEEKAAVPSQPRNRTRSGHSESSKQTQFCSLLTGLLPMLLYFNDANYFYIDAILKMGGFDVLHYIHLTMPRAM